MNGENNIEVLLSLRDNATPQMTHFTGALADNRRVIRELASGTGYLGSAMLGMSIAMQASNNAALKATGNMLAMVGGVLTAIASAAHFVAAIGRMTSALQRLNIAQAIANALAGPAGWAKLAIGGAVAGGAIYGITRAMAGGERRTVETTKIDVHVAGSVVTDRQLVDGIHGGLLLKSQRNAGTGIR